MAGGALNLWLSGPRFIPDCPQRELREAVRYRHRVIEERAREVNRIQKVPEGGHIKLGSVISDVLGISGRAMLRALAQGEEDVERLADPVLELRPIC